MLLMFFALVPLTACRMLAGGPVTVDVNRDDIQKMATFAMGELNTLLGSQNTLVKVVSAKTQVVAGTNYILSLQLQQGGITKACNVTVWSRPWLHDNRLTHHVCSGNKRAVRASVDVNRADVQSMAAYALTEINKRTGNNYKIDHIDYALTTVGSGTTYDMMLRLTNGTTLLHCEVFVLYEPTTSTKSILRLHMYPSYTLVPAPINTQVKDGAKFALNQINGVDETQFKLDEIISAKKPNLLAWSFQSYVLTLRLTENGKTKVCTVRVKLQISAKRWTLEERSCSVVR